MTKNDQLLRHLTVADSRMRELFGFYWHRRDMGLGGKRMDQLTKEIKTSEKILAKLKKGKQ